jgi:hypothetical protein
MIFAGQGVELRLDAGGIGFGLGLAVRRLLHHQKPPAPSTAARIMPMNTALLSQRIAILAITKKMTSKTAPAMMKMVVKLISISVQLAVCSVQRHFN